MIYPDVLTEVIDTYTASREYHPLAEIITISRYMHVRVTDEIIPRDIIYSNAIYSNAVSTTDWAQGHDKDGKISK